MGNGATRQEIILQLCLIMNILVLRPYIKSLLLIIYHCRLLQMFLINFDVVSKETNDDSSLTRVFPQQMEVMAWRNDYTVGFCIWCNYSTKKNLNAG